MCLATAAPLPPPEPQPAPAPPFDPEGSGYDYATAKDAGMGPDGTGDNAGHWGSTVPTTAAERLANDLPPASYLLLKGAKHDTFHKADLWEGWRGNKITKGVDGRYYSVPEEMP